jgi:hypothetical protein
MSRQSSFPQTKEKSLYPYPHADLKDQDAREGKAGLSQWQRHSRPKSSNWKAYGNDVVSSSRQVLLAAWVL